MFLRASVLPAVLLLTACGSPIPATPALEPTPNPTPVPSPTPATARVACGVGAGTGDGLQEHCPRTSPSFLAEVDAAINRVVDRHPELVDLDDRAGRGGYFVRNIDEFFRQVVEEVAEGSRLCAIVDADLEIAVKRNNAFSDQYKLMWSSGYIRRGDSSYRATCVPAWF
ncbi:MAG TPA: hypothetical protein VMR21_14065 [Vicinamibacteria bacterium]|nr:hypothetical protein [Vicinamibacteria bacterium]